MLYCIYVTNPVMYFFYGMLLMATVVPGKERMNRAVPRVLSKGARRLYFELSQILVSAT